MGKVCQREVGMSMEMGRATLHGFHTHPHLHLHPSSAREGG